LSTNDTPNFIREVEQLILARALFYLCRENPDDSVFVDLLAFMEKIQETVHAAGWVSKEIEILVLQSLAHQQKENKEQAMRFFESALKLAKPESHLRPFLDEGEPIQILLRNAYSDRFAADFCQKLLDAFDDKQEMTYHAKEQVATQGLVDPLSRRELEVLDLLASDLSGPEIANQLVIAVSTLRYHTNQIYTKLAVHSRREAVTRAKELEII
jgi:LuxR family maltose regulon positive regulatory protein